ncbi:MAG: hypothetical protein H7X77_04780, partial [Anaerolineae bacterium]|nr:hypothetical protein [Anaerolineae bacterium]
MRQLAMRFICGIFLVNILLFFATLLFAQTGTWETVATDNLPIERHETSFVHVGGKFYLIGGRESKIVQIYDPTTNEWTNGASAPSVMHHIQPVVLDNLIYTIAPYSGNCCDDEFGLANNYIYDPAQNKWLTGGIIPEERRRGASGVVYYQDSFYILGGLTGGHGLGNDGISADSHNWFDRWNPYTNDWQILPNMVRDRDHFGAAVVGNRLYATSGRFTEGMSSFNNTIAEIDVYNFDTAQWSTLPAAANIPTERAGTGVVVMGDEIFVIGGESGAQNTAHAEAEAFNTADNTWRTLDMLIEGRHGTTASVCNGVVYIAAGSPTRGAGRIATMERYYETVANSCPATTITPGQITSNNNGDFGQVEVGQNLTKTITITHSSGNQALVITGFSKTGSADFSADFPFELPVVMAPGMSIDISVTYTPGGIGTDTGALAFTRHNSNQPLQVALAGEGVDEAPATATPTTTSTPVDQPTATNTPTSTENTSETATELPTLTSTSAFTVTPPLETATPTSESPTVTVSFTPDLTATATATTSAGVELVVNGSFEAKNGENKPDFAPWILKNGLKDKIKCDKEGKPPVAYTGDCAFRFKGSSVENAKLQQNIALANFDFTIDDLLTLSLYIKTGSTVSGKIKVTVAYSDSLLAKSKIPVTLT